MKRLWVTDNCRGQILVFSLVIDVAEESLVEQFSETDYSFFFGAKRH